MNIAIKLHAECKSVHLSRESIERYVDYKLNKIYSKSYLSKYKEEKITVYIDQRETKTVVKIITSFNKKDIIVLSEGQNPYKVIRTTLQKLERKLRKTKETIHSTSAYHSKDKEIKQKTQDAYMQDMEESTTDEDFGMGDFDFAEDLPNAEEDLFQKLINEF